MAVKLAIVTPDQEALALECDEVVVPGARGEIGLLPGHVPLITTLRPGVLTIVNGTKKAFYAVASGYAEVEGDTVTILTDSCEESGKVDVQRAQRAQTDAEAQLLQLSPDTAGFAEQHLRVLRARARIDAAARR